MCGGSCLQYRRTATGGLFLWNTTSTTMPRSVSCAGRSLQTGKSRAFVNDSPVSASTLKLLAAEVIDIHSQHQNLLMGREHFLLDILDAVANNQEVKDAYARCFHEWHEACKALKQLKEQRAQDQANHDFLQFQFDQLERRPTCRPTNKANWRRNTNC